MFELIHLKPSFQGHSKNITAFSISEDKSTLYTGSFDARICIFFVLLIAVNIHVFYMQY